MAQVHTRKTALQAKLAKDADAIALQLRLLTAFGDDRYTWRSIAALTLATGASVDDVRSALSAIGARKSKGRKEVYTFDADTTA